MSKYDPEKRVCKCLKGTVSRDGCWDKTMEWKIRPNGRKPFALFKNARLEATVRSIVHTLMKKRVFQIWQMLLRLGF
jgi:hypothetical protein